MMRFAAVMTLFPDLGEAELRAWVERGWVHPEEGEQKADEPEGAAPDWRFQDIDIARVRLIRDVRRTMGVAEETTPLVLSLLDQIYTLRGQVNALARAIEAQPAPVRAAILAAIRG